MMPLDPKSVSSGSNQSQENVSPLADATLERFPNRVLSAVSEATHYLCDLISEEPEVMVVLGSGLGDVVQSIPNCVSIPFGEIPGFEGATVEGHKGQYHFGKLAGRSVLLQQGRTHYYEGVEHWRAVLPALVGKSLGVKTFILTNAVGSLEPAIPPESLVVVTNLLAFQMRDPLMAHFSPEMGALFYDTTHPFDMELCKHAENHFKKSGILTSRGTYAWMEGPRYDTAAEIADLRARAWIIRNILKQPDLAPTVVGMSLGPEVAALSRDGKSRILALSFVSNYAAGVEPGRISHADVLERGESFAARFAPALCSLIEVI